MLPLNSRMWTLGVCIVFTTGLLHIVTGNDGKSFQNTLGHLHPENSAEVQTSAVENLVVRVLGKDADLFKVTLDPDLGPKGKDTFNLKKLKDNKVIITGTSGVAVAWGLHYYLTTYCNCHVSWEGSQLNLPKILPDVNETVSSNDRFRYYQNVCTAGYSSAWWKWPQWEKNIDWMALNSINLALAFHGQEAIWQKVYLKMQLKKEEIDQHFSGPAFLPWSRMGNFRGWGGPLSQAWHNHTIQLQHSIVRRMRELGITPVLPAFAGHVPRDFIRVFPEANVTKVVSWNGFEDQYCCPYSLDPTDPLFKTVGREFLKAYTDEFGTNHIYNCDSFNENDPHTGDLDYLSNTGKAIYSGMTGADPDAIWLMQGWLFVHSEYFWTFPRVKAFVTSVPIGKMIILDLQSEQFPQYKRFHSYFGQPFIWCMLHNFGGTLGMFGSAGVINKGVFEARTTNGSTMIGTGLTPEGINQNYVIYEFMNEMSYRKKPVVLDNWFENYAVRRYGQADESIRTSWQELGRELYNYDGKTKIRGHYVITKRPSLNIEPWYWYDLKTFLAVWNSFVHAGNGTMKNELFKHDLVDITRQALQITADFIYADIKAAYTQKNLTQLQIASSHLLDLFDDLEKNLASSKDFLLGSWLEDAKAIAPEGATRDRENYEFNARNQITLWGPRGEIVDYANKQWSGVVADYFKPRWEIYLKELQESIRKQTAVPTAKLKRMIFNQVELPFSYSKKLYPTQPKGDSILIAKELYAKWQRFW
ncbi:alpha-N-acetylglucosaminidase isoform X1 [Nasonia vitripennis]|uniref:Alpha-N-acetylglucosaminidase n=1 Tax=Nasonia vitripennis TaxID=7425 RepID=A0A7M7QJQ1_NASVI|nr:alpha-N-acetylglucosaminidase isoform X1 [Nasonia vitripennis]